MRPIVLRIRRPIWTILALSLMAMALVPLSVWAQSDNRISLRLQKSEVQFGEEIELDLVLANAPEGVQRFDISLFIEDPSVAQVQGIRGGVISGPFFQVVNQTERSVEFRAVDLDDLINPESKDLVLATLNLAGMQEGETGFNVEINLFVSDKDNHLEPLVEVGSSLSVITAPELITGPQVGLSPIGGYENPPQDLDGDGVYEDIDGDGEFTAKDIALFAYHVDSEMIQRYRQLFDFDGDGGANFADAMRLASLIELSSASLPIIRLEDKTVTIERDVDLDLVLANAPGGLQWYDITLLVEDSNIAQLELVESRAIDERFFEVVRQTASSIEFRAVDLRNEVLPGAEDLLLATISLTAVQPGQTAIWMIVDPMIDDQGRGIEPLVRSGSLNFVVFTIGRSSAPPTDLDGDGLFEDINGDGRLTFEDVRIFSFNFSSRVVQDNWQLFDFDSDGGVDFDDAMAFVGLAEEDSTPTQ